MHTPRAVAAALAVATLLPAGARAHGVRHEVELRDGAVSVRVLHHGGRALAGAEYEVFAPGEPGGVRDQGRTDPHGWLVFVPDAPGAWRVKVADATGHGAVVEVEVPPAQVASPAPAGRLSPPAERATPAHGAAAPEEGRAGTGPDPGGDPGALRVAGGAAALALAFAALFALQRRRRAAGR